MKINKITYLIATILLLGQTSLFAQNLKVPLNPKVKTGELENGLKYYILENQKPKDKVELRLVVNAGSVLETDAQQGLAHFCEHMAFNGTKNFKKNELVDYLQSVGVKFGAHLNAYTSFDETVYMLSLPSDDKDILDKGFQILQDWAGAVSYDGDEIDKERGVVIEEYRLRLGAENRMMQEYLPKLMYKSQYADRLPIGKKAILENFEHKEARQFYKDWYRPNLMSVIVVGDIDEKEIEKKVKSLFSKLENPSKPKKRKFFDIKDHDETFVSVLSDKEATRTEISIYIKQDGNVERDNTVAYYENQLRKRFFSSMFNARLREISQSPDAPFSYAWTGLRTIFSRSKAGFSMTAISTEQNKKDAYEKMVQEIQRVKKYGFQKSELDRILKDYQASLEAQLKERNTTESRRYLGGLQSHFLYGSAAPDVEWKLEHFSKFRDELDITSINALAAKWIRQENSVIIVKGPEIEDETAQVLDDGMVLAYWKDAENLELEEYQDNVLPNELIGDIPQTGSIVSTTKNNEAGIVEMTLSNGAKVVYKKTDFKADQVLFRAFSKGGLSLLSDQEFQRVRHGIGVISNSGVGQFSETDLEKMLSGKRVGVSPYISDLSEGMRGSAAPKDVDELFQLVHLFFTQPRKDEAAFETYKNRQLSLTKNLESSPTTYFQIKWREFQDQEHPRNWKIAKEGDWADTDYESIYSVTKKRFSNPGDFTFVFVGNVDEKELEEYVKKYLCPLEAGTKEKYNDVGMRPKKGSDVLKIKKGTEPKAMVSISFSGEAKYSGEEDYYLSSLGEVLKIKLTETLREEMSGVYGSSAFGGMSEHPYGAYYFGISFPCGPDNVDDLKNRALAELQKLIDNGPTTKDVEKVKEAQLRDYQLNMKSNRYWLNKIKESYYSGSDVNEILKTEEKIKSLTPGDLQKVAKKYLNGDHLEGILLPEK